MKEVLPFDLLQDIVDQLGSENAPLEVLGKKYRPVVFQVNATRHYVFCLTPITTQPHDFFDEVEDAYERYLDGGVTKYIFFRDMNGEALKMQVLEWYNAKVA